MTLVGRKLGKYEITDLIARGRMAHIYKAKQPGLGRDVVIKVMLNYLSHDDQFVARFRREAESLAQLRHPNIIRLFDMDNEGDHYFMVMEYIRGGDLHHLLHQQGKLTPAQSLDILIPVADALASAHEVGIIHRDIKPPNILFATTPGEHPVITDFGITLMQGSLRLTGSGNYLGTPMYMSPESGLGEIVDHRTDIYSLGITLYELLTGKLPFMGTSPSEVFLNKLYDPLPDLDTTMPDVPDEVKNIIRTSLQSSKRKRYQSADEIKQAMEIARAELAIASVPVVLSDTEPPAEAPNTVYVQMPDKPIIKDKAIIRLKSKQFVTYTMLSLVAISVVTIYFGVIINQTSSTFEIPGADAQSSVVQWADETDIFTFFNDATSAADLKQTPTIEPTPVNEDIKVTARATLLNNLTLTKTPTVIPTIQPTDRITPTSEPTVTPLPTETPIIATVTITNEKTIDAQQLIQFTDSVTHAIHESGQTLSIVLTQLPDMIPVAAEPTIISYELGNDTPPINRVITGNTIHQYQLSAAPAVDQSLIILTYDPTHSFVYTLENTSTQQLISQSRALLTAVCLQIPPGNDTYQLTLELHNEATVLSYITSLQRGDFAQTSCELKS